MSEKRASRLPPIAEPPEDPLLAEIFEGIKARGGRILNVHRASGHAPKIFKAYAAFAAALRFDTTLGRPLSELLILRVALCDESDYELSVHRRMARECGIPADKIAAVEHWRDSPLFDARERIALTFAEMIAKDGAVDDATFATLGKFFSPREITELAALTSYYAGNARFLRALGVANEEET
jgi:4-carboxymuconolactone decarboxylase